MADDSNNSLSTLFGVDPILELTPIFGLAPYIADSVQRQGGSRMQGCTKWVLIYATRVWPGFESRYRSLSTPRLGFLPFGL